MAGLEPAFARILCLVKGHINPGHQMYQSGTLTIWSHTHRPPQGIKPWFPGIFIRQLLSHLSIEAKCPIRWTMEAF